MVKSYKQVNREEREHQSKEESKGNIKRACLLAIIALLIGFIAYISAINAQTTADINNVFEIVVNNTNLAPHIAADVPGTGERVTGVTYFANTSPIELLVFAHANTVSGTATVEVNINGTAVANQSGRPLGGAEETHRSITVIVPKYSSYVVNFSNYHHYEWREYPILSGKNGTVSVNQTFITNITNTFNATYDQTTKEFNSNYSAQTFPNSTIVSNNNTLSSTKVNKTNIGEFTGGSLNYTSGYYADRTKTYTFFGDSITDLSTVRDGAIVSKKYQSLLNTTIGISNINQATAGDQIADSGIIDNMFAQVITSANQSVALLGYNDMRFYGFDNGGINQTYNNTLYSGLAYLSIPETQKFNASNSAWTFTGTWVGQSVYGDANHVKSTTTQNDHADITLTGDTIYFSGIMLQTATPTGNFSIKIDGVSQGTFTTVNGTTTGNGRFYQPLFFRFTGLTNVAHTLTITKTDSNAAGQIYVHWAAGVDSTTFKGNKIYLGNTLKMTPTGYSSSSPYNKGSDSNNTLINSVMSTVVSKLNSDGMQITLIDMNVPYDPYVDLASDSIHPNTFGHTAIANAFISQIAKTQIQIP